jgi:hypothetical protein
VKRPRFTEAQIVGILKELGRRHYRHRPWPQARRAWQYDPPVARRLETSDLARLTMEVDAVKELIAKNGWRPSSEKK